MRSTARCAGTLSIDRGPHRLAATVPQFVCSPARREVVRERKPSTVLDIRGRWRLRHAFNARIGIRHFYPERSTVPSEAQRYGLGAVSHCVRKELTDDDERVLRGDGKGCDELLRVLPRDRNTRRHATVTKPCFHEVHASYPAPSDLPPSNRRLLLGAEDVPELRHLYDAQRSAAQPGHV